MHDNQFNRPAGYEHYNQRYNNAAYAKLRLMIKADLDTPDDNHPDLVTLMNLITDAALDISGVGQLGEPTINLAYVVSRAAYLRAETVDTISTYMSIFEPKGSVKALDYAATVEALLKTQQAQKLLNDAVESAAAIHGRYGNAAHAALVSALLTVNAALALLHHDNSSYPAEHLEEAEASWRNAVSHARLSDPAYKKLLRPFAHELGDPDRDGNFVGMIINRGDLAAAGFSIANVTPEIMQRLVDEIISRLDQSELLPHQIQAAATKIGIPRVTRGI